MSTRVSLWRTRATDEFIETRRQEHDVELICRSLGVARGGYYARLKKPYQMVPERMLGCSS